MAWQIPKTNWQTPDGVAAADMNRIEGNTEYLNEQILNTLPLIGYTKEGNVHVLSTQLTGQFTAKFNATNNYVYGDTWQINGITYTGITQAGKALETGAFIAGSKGIIVEIDTESRYIYFNITPPAKISPSSDTIYVRKTGSDITGDGSSANPFLTISKALAVLKTYAFIPTTFRIYIGDGTYNEGDYLSVWHKAPSLEFRSESGDKSKVTITTTLQIQSSNVKISCLTFTGPSTSYMIYCMGSGCTYITECTITVPTTSNIYGIYATMGAAAYVDYTDINGCYSAISTGPTGQITSINNSGSGNKYGLRADGGIIIKNSTQPSATTPEDKIEGGQIFG